MMKVSVRIASDTENPAFVATLGKRPKTGETFFDPQGRGPTIDDAKKALLVALYDAGVIKMPERRPLVRKPKATPPPDAIPIVS
jgi:hypothetical protein